MSTFPYEQRESTSLFVTLGRMIGEHAADPAKLAVVVTAYEKAGWHMPWCEIHGVSDDEARGIINAALRNRHKKLLRARADGLLLALASTAGPSDRWRTLQVQIDAAVVEVRELTGEERFARLRAMDDNDARERAKEGAGK